MKNKRLLTVIMLVVLGGLTSLQAQEIVTTTGGEATGSGGSMSYTIGQTFYTTNIGTNDNRIIQGVQQPFEISVVIDLPEAKNISLNFSAYPNPTTNYLTVKIDASTMLTIQSMEYQVYDINGKLLKIVKATGVETQIQTYNLIPSTYFVKVLDNKKEIKVFKIIKN